MLKKIILPLAVVLLVVLVYLGSGGDSGPDQQSGADRPESQFAPASTAQGVPESQRPVESATGGQVVDTESAPVSVEQRAGGMEMPGSGSPFGSMEAGRQVDSSAVAAGGLTSVAGPRSEVEMRAIESITSPPGQPGGVDESLAPESSNPLDAEAPADHDLESNSEAPEAGVPQIQGLPPEASDPGTVGPAPEDSGQNN